MEENKRNKVSKHLIQDDVTSYSYCQPMPSEKPTKFIKSDFIQEEKSQINLGKENRLKAFKMMKDDFNNSSKLIANNSLVDKFGEYLNEKLKVREDQDDLYTKQENIYDNKNNVVKPHHSSNLKVNLEEAFGISTDFNKCVFNQHSALCFHKKDKWIAYINSNLIIVENFNVESEEKSKNKNYNNYNKSSNNIRKQKIINTGESKNILDVIKISENGKYLMAYSTVSTSNTNNTNSNSSFPVILFYNIPTSSSNSQDKTQPNEFTLLNKTTIKHNFIKDCEISPQNNMCIVISSNENYTKNQNNTMTYISALNFFHNEILMTTVLNVDYFMIKWNPYLVNLEFVTLSIDLFTFWRVNSVDCMLQYQHGDISENEPETENSKFVCMDYTPPLSFNCVILLLLGLSDGSIWGVDTKTNSINIKFPSLLNSSFKSILCSPNYLVVVHSNLLKTYKMPSIKNINHDDLNLFVNGCNEITFDSDLIAINLDLTFGSCGVALTKTGGMYLIDLLSHSAVRTTNFNSGDEQVVAGMILNTGSNYAIKEDLTNAYNYAGKDLDLINAKMYFITAYNKFKNGKNSSVKIWSVENYNYSENNNTINDQNCFTLTTKLDNPTEDILAIDCDMINLKIAISYSSGNLRFFDFANSTFLGKHNSFTSYKYLKFLPDGLYLFAVDGNNSIYLIKVERYSPLLLHVHSLFNISNEIIEFKLHLTESYNKFLINVQDVYLQIYNRKFVNILKNLSYDNSLPNFYLQDKFNVGEYLTNLERERVQDQSKINTQINKKINSVQNLKCESFQCEFSPSIEDKSRVYILSRARGVLLVRNFESHTIEKVIKLRDNPIKFVISPDWAYKAVLYHDKIEFSDVTNETKGEVLTVSIPYKNKQTKSGTDENFKKYPEISTYLNMVTTSNGKQVIVFNSTTYLLYNVASSFN